MAEHLGDIYGGAGKKFGKTPSLCRCFRVKGKGTPVDLQVMFLLQFFNTPGNEIAPGSYIIRKYL
ncbi:MAG TPA: hypothetical protein VJ969_11540 [Desulfopila sp.]|nr:hypothetical protein [Desulfopila sp.]